MKLLFKDCFIGTKFSFREQSRNCTSAVVTELLYGKLCSVKQDLVQLLCELSNMSCYQIGMKSSSVVCVQPTLLYFCLCL